MLGLDVSVWTTKDRPDLFILHFLVQALWKPVWWVGKKSPMWLCMTHDDTRWHIMSHDDVFMYMHEADLTICRSVPKKTTVGVTIFISYLLYNPQAVWEQQDNDEWSQDTTSPRCFSGRQGCRWRRPGEKCQSQDRTRDATDRSPPVVSVGARSELMIKSLLSKTCDAEWINKCSMPCFRAACPVVSSMNTKCSPNSAQYWQESV